MIKRNIRRVDLEKDPNLTWNEFVDLVIMEHYDDLTKIQRTAHLCLWYESEVNNGGHLQYFENRGIDHLSETIEALKIIGTPEIASILESAGRQFKSRKRNPILSVYKYIKKAKEGEYDKYDSNFYDIRPSIGDLLEKYLNNNINEFIEFS